ncbi:MAG: hypothetical protein Q9191_000474 [Dirinaria sp. TL-2023a]
MKRIFVACLAAGHLAAALPNTSPSYFSYTQTSKFDNIESVPGAAVGPVGDNSIDENLKWSGFSLVETMFPTGEGVVPGVIPQSAPNLIAFATDDVETINEVQERERARDFVTDPGETTGTPQITSNFEDSQTAFFDLISMFIACSSATEASVTALPVPCNITVTGFTPAPNPKQVGPPATFRFVPPGGTSADMVPVALPSYFRGLGSAVFTLQSANNAVTSGLVDNVQNTITSTAPVSSS